jgi:hypothetical protein
MADINFKQIIDDSIAFSKGELGSTFKKLKPFAEHEFRQFAENAAFLAKLKLQGTIDNEELKSRLQLQKLALSNVLLAIKGIGIVTAQNLVNGVLAIIGKAIKSAINVSLPV